MIIRLGHYQEKTSIGSDKPNIIRILGPDKTRENYWLTQDNKIIPDYELEEYYIFLDYNSSKQKQQSLPANIFDDFEEVLIENVSNEKIINVQNQIQNELVTNQDNIEAIYPTKFISKPKPVSFDISVIDAILISTLNKKSMEKFGIEKYSKPIIDIDIPITFDYDISKLKYTIELLDLNENIILDHLINKIPIENIRLLLKQKIKKLLSEDIPTLKIIELPKEPIIEKIQEPIIEKIQEPIIEISDSKVNNESLDEQISEVSQYLNTLI